MVENKLRDEAVAIGSQVLSAIVKGVTEDFSLQAVRLPISKALPNQAFHLLMADSLQKGLRVLAQANKLRHANASKVPADEPVKPEC